MRRWTIGLTKDRSLQSGVERLIRSIISAQMAKIKSERIQIWIVHCLIKIRVIDCWDDALHPLCMVLLGSNPHPTNWCPNRHTKQSARTTWTICYWKSTLFGTDRHGETWESVAQKSWWQDDSALQIRKHKGVCVISANGLVYNTSNVRKESHSHMPSQTSKPRKQERIPHIHLSFPLAFSAPLFLSLINIIDLSLSRSFSLSLYI